MPKSDRYRGALQSLPEWDDYLLQHSGLPQPRANIEPAQVVAELGDEKRFRCYLAFAVLQAPVNSTLRFLARYGAAGFGGLLAEGKR